MSGGNDRPVFGASLDEWRKCSREGCLWHAHHSLLCRDHGGKARDFEYRTDDYGRTEFRGGYTGEIVPAGRTA